MNYKLPQNFIKEYFPNIEGALLFGSYINNPTEANDVDLLLLSNKFSYASKESFLFEKKKINVIKLNLSEVFSILAKHYQQGDFYRLVFVKGIILLDQKNDVQFIRQYINNTYPNKDKDILAFGLNETTFKLTEYKSTLKKPLSEIEYFTITSKIVFHLMDWFLLSNSIHNFKDDNKYKSGFFNKYFPVESDKLLKLISTIKNYNPKDFLLVLHSITKEYNIPNKDKYSNNLIFDDYSQPNLILYLEYLFNFQEIKEIITKLKVENNKIQFYIYQVDEDNQEKIGCYIVFDNSELVFEKERQKWLYFFQTYFSKHQYSFPYNNIFCFPEIKFVGKRNEQLANRLLTNCTNAISENNATKETFLLSLLNAYLSKTETKIDNVYNFYLGKLNSKNRSSNYFTNKNKETENKFLAVNQSNEKKLIAIFKETKKIDLSLEFITINNAPIWLHFQIIDRLISPLLKNDFEKLFYIHCLKRTLNE